MSLVVVGTMAYDAIETPFGKTDKILGGAATFIALASAYLYDEVKAISVVGNDFDPNYIKMLEDRGISLEGVQIIPDQKSFFWSGRYHNDMNSRDTLITELNVLADFDPKVPDSYQDCEYLMLGNLTPAVQKSVIERLNKRPACIAMDTMNFWMDTAMESLLEVIKHIDGLIINDEEARQLSQEYSLKKASQVIMGMGPEFLVIKKGEHGALLFYKDEMFFAEKGQGAFSNRGRLRVSGREKPHEALLATGIPFKGQGDPEQFVKELEFPMQETAGVRRWGTASLDLAYVAAGRFDGFWERDLASWDIAAGILMVKEAGGLVTELNGARIDVTSASILAANPDLHQLLQKRLTSHT